MSGSHRRRIAIVIPWFGRDLRGGAELTAWFAASNLAVRGHSVDVLTTCCRSFHDDWAQNHLPAGRERQPEGFEIVRFPVETRDQAAFDRVNAKLLGMPASELIPGAALLSPHEEAIFCDDLIRSSQLVSHVVSQAPGYDAIIFLPYLYSPIIQALPQVADRALLQPCLHDEPYAYLKSVDTLFRKARALLFNSEGEQELAARMFGPAVLPKSRCIGLGIEIPGRLDELRLPPANAARLGKYVVFIGRKTAEKGVGLLIAAMHRYRAAHSSATLNLVLAGGGPDHPEAPGIIDLGRVDDDMKWALLQGSLAGVSPGTNESYSRTMYEAWACRRPVLVHGACLATAVAVRRAGGGWIATTEEDFCRAFLEIERASPESLSAAGIRGHAYALEFASWERSTDRYEDAIAACCAVPEIRAETRRPRAVHQLLPNLNYGDAISNEAIFIRNQIRAWGGESHIYARYIDRRVLKECRVFTPGCLPRNDGILYHHSIGSEVTLDAIHHPGPKALIYHNITPPHFFQPFRPEFAKILAKGLEDLYALAPVFPVSAGDSGYNASELAAHGFHDPLVLPLAIDPRMWDHSPDAGVIRAMRDGPLNVLFVGCIAPNKKQEDLVAAFKHLVAFCPEARLTLIGGADTSDVYLQHVKNAIREHGLEQKVHMTGHITDPEIQAYFCTAHLYWSMSEHEGFCVPIIEAMWFDVPVFAYKSTAVPETLGAGGLLFTDKSDLDNLAATALLLGTDSELRLKIIQAQRSRREHYLGVAVSRHLDRLLTRMASQ